MDNVKAVQVLTKWIRFLTFPTAEGGRPINSSLGDLLEATTAAITALGKQIPKPVVVKTREGYILPLYHCPVCDEQIGDAWRYKREGRFCPECGQKLSF